MNEKNKFKLQAHLDGELSSGEAREFSETLSKDAEAQSLLTELKFIKAALRGNEMELKLPETREFYWSKIRREIARDSQQAAPRPIVRWWKPAYVRFAGIVAAGCGLLMISFIAFNGQNESYATDEVEGTGEEMGSITYHSDKEGMTVVYLFDRDADLK
ncbi:MAG: hypothetical protein ABIP71_08945 [Verrucomicrobiota bacterium]